MSAPVICSMDIPRGKRILVTSDILGHVEHLQNVLRLAEFHADDVLVIVGDILEKGPDSLAALRYIMQLCQNGNTIALMGNVDLSRLGSIDAFASHPENAADFLAYLQMMRDWKGTSFYDEMCKEIGFLPNTTDELLQTLPQILSHFSKELTFLRQLPTALVTSNFLFVHGGIPSPAVENHLSELEDMVPLLKFDNFQTYAREHHHRFTHTVVCGHWPTSLYSDSIACQNPIIDPQTNTIAIDGGCGLKKEGQLNLLILPSIDCKLSEISYLSYDGLPTITALEQQAASEDSVHIHWGDTAGKVVEIGAELFLVEHLRTGKQFWMPKEDLYNYQEPLVVGSFVDLNDWTDYYPNIKPGDTLSVVRRLTYGIQIKKNGVTGWYTGDYREKEC